MKVNKDISRKYFSFLAYQRSLQFLYETLDTLIETLTAFTDRQTDKSKDQTLKQHHLGSKNNLSDYRRPNYFSRIGSGN